MRTIGRAILVMLSCLYVFVAIMEQITRNAQSAQTCAVIGVAFGVLALALR